MFSVHTRKIIPASTALAASSALKYDPRYFLCPCIDKCAWNFLLFCFKTPLNLQHHDLAMSCSFLIHDYQGHQLLQHGDMRTAVNQSVGEMRVALNALHQKMLVALSLACGKIIAVGGCQLLPYTLLKGLPRQPSQHNGMSYCLCQGGTNFMLFAVHCPVCIEPSDHL